MSINSVIYKNLYCNKDNLIISVDSDNWFNLLLINKSFHYQYESLHCHFSKDKKGYWTAIKIIDRKRRVKRMGISYDLTVENMLSVVYRLNLTQDDYELLQQNKKQHSIHDSKTWLKFTVECQRQEILKLKKQVEKLESQLSKVQNSTESEILFYTEHNGNKIPVYSE